MQQTAIGLVHWRRMQYSSVVQSIRWLLLLKQNFDQPNGSTKTTHLSANQISTKNAIIQCTAHLIARCIPAWLHWLPINQHQRSYWATNVFLLIQIVLFGIVLTQSNCLFWTQSVHKRFICATLQSIGGFVQRQKL